MAAQDDAREKKIRDLFNLRIDPDRKRADTDAYLDRPDFDPVPFELKSTTKTSISTVRDFNPDHVKKWRDEHWLFGFFDAQQELQYCCYASPAMMKPWIDRLEAYVRPDIELAARLGSHVTEDDLIAILGDKEVYSSGDAWSIHKKQWKKQQYLDAFDVEAGYTRERLLTVLAGGMTPEQVVTRLGDKPVYTVAEVRKGLPRGRWRKAFLEQVDVPAGYWKARMVEILQERARYILDRGTTLNNPHISKTFFDGFEKITSNQAMRVRELVAQAEELAAKGIAPAEAAVMRAAAEDAIPDDGGSEPLVDENQTG